MTKDSEILGKDIVNFQNEYESVIMEVRCTIKDGIKDKSVETFKSNFCNEWYITHYNSFQELIKNPSNKSIDDFIRDIVPDMIFIDIDFLMKLVDVENINLETVKRKLYDFIQKTAKIRQTSVALFFNAVENSNLQLKKPESQNFEEIVERLAQDPHEYSLEDLCKLRTNHHDKLRELNLQYSSLMLLGKVENSKEVVVTWLVRADEAVLFERMFKTCISEGVFFDENSLMDASIKGHVFQSTETALLEASYKDNIKRVDRLLSLWGSSKCNINKANKEGKTSLVIASELGHSGVVALLLEQGMVAIDYQVPGCDWTALFYAYAGGHMNTVKILEEYGASKEIKDKDGKTPHAVSTITDHQKHAALKRPTRRTIVREKFDSIMTNLSFQKKSFEKRIHKLCENGNYEELKKMIEEFESNDVVDTIYNNWTLLMEACYGGHYDIVVFLLMKGADIHAKSPKNWTTLTIAASRNHLRIANLLLIKGANRDDIIDPNELHQTALMFVSDKGDIGYVEMARALLKHGAGVDICDKTNSTPLFYAIQKNDEKMVKLFLEYKANYNRQTKNGWSPLMESARTSAKLCQLLLDHGAETELAMENAGKVSGDTALHVACFYGNADVVKTLVEGGADINRENEIGLTPVMVATKQLNLNTIKSLTQFRSLNVNQAHKKTGFSAAILASSVGAIEICKQLLDHGAFPEIGGVKIQDVAPRRLRKEFTELFKLYEYTNFPKAPVVYDLDNKQNTEATSAKSHEIKHEENVMSITSSTKSWADEGQEFDGELHHGREEVHEMEDNRDFEEGEFKKKSEEDGIVVQHATTCEEVPSETKAEDAGVFKGKETEDDDLSLYGEDSLAVHKLEQMKIADRLKQMKIILSDYEVAIKKIHDSSTPKGIHELEMLFVPQDLQSE